MPIIVANFIANNDPGAFAVVQYAYSGAELPNTYDYDSYRTEVMETQPFREVEGTIEILTPIEVNLPGEIGAHHVGYVREYEIETPLQAVALTLDRRHAISPMEVGAPGYDVAANGIQVQFRAVHESQAQFYPLLPPTVKP